MDPEFKEEIKGNPVVKSWFLTLNNPTEDEVKILQGWTDDVNRIRVCREVGEQGTPHIHAAITFKTAKRFSAVKKLLPRGNWQKIKCLDSAYLYCAKDGSDVIVDVDNRKQGERVDLARSAEVIMSHSTWRNVVRDPNLMPVTAKYMQWARAIFDHRTRAERPMPPLRVWQQALHDELQTEPDDRKIIWYVDKPGGAGKSFFIRHYIRQHPDVFYCTDGKDQDILYAYSETLASIVFFDLPRDTGRIPYTTMEAIKNGVFFSGKYKSISCAREGNCHLIIFANIYPDESCLSADRWDIRELEGGALAMAEREPIVPKGVVPYSFGPEEPESSETEDETQQSDSPRRVNIYGSPIRKEPLTPPRRRRCRFIDDEARE